MKNLRIVGIKYPPEYFEHTKRNFPMPDDDALPENCRWEFAAGPEDANCFLLAEVGVNLDFKLALRTDIVNLHIFEKDAKPWQELAAGIMKALGQPVLYAADIEAKMSGVFYEGFASHKYDYDE